MPVTALIVTIVLVYIWVLEPMAPLWLRQLPIALVVSLAIARAVKTGEWGVRPRAFVPALRDAAILTLSAAGACLVAGMLLETVHARDNPLGELAFLLVWGGAQQFVLQTVVLPESYGVAGKRGAPFLAAAIFAAMHLPNPFLTAMTLIGGIFWCRIYMRHPNILPLAMSHALATMAILASFDDGLTGRLRVGVSYLRLD